MTVDLPWTSIRGWFQVGWTADLPPEAVIPLHFLGRDLVAWRAAGGAPVVAGAHCPHMGAHLGFGGSVEHGCIRCPLHGWTWGSDGRNVAVPSSDTTSTRRLRAWPTEEFRGALFVWHDPLGRGPGYGLLDELSLLPACGDTSSALAGGFPGAARVHSSLAIHPQFAVEDRVDVDHFAGPHTTDLPDLLRLDIREHSFTSVVAHPGGKDEPGAHIESLVVGVGLSLLTVEFGAQTTDILLGVTPVDEGTSDIFHTVWCRSSPEAPETAESALRSVVPLMRRELEHDLVVWSHLAYAAEVSSEHFRSAGPIAAVRDWAACCYPGIDRQSPDG